jgi:hypothetical protein
MRRWVLNAAVRRGKEPKGYTGVRRIGVVRLVRIGVNGVIRVRQFV